LDRRRSGEELIMRLPLFRIGTGTFLVLSACSLVNALDDVTPSAEGVYAPGTAPGGDASIRLDRDAGGGGVVVVAGEESHDGAARFVLTTLDPTTGRPLGARETVTVAAIRYDGLRDHWYLFESKGNYAPAPEDKVVLRTRTLDIGTGEWKDLGALEVPSLQSADSIAVVRDRLVYVAHKPGDELALVSIDTSDPTNPAIVSNQPLPIGRAPRGMVGTRSRTNVGGVVTMFRTNAGGENCPEGGTCFEVLRVRVGQGVPTVEEPFAISGAIPGFPTAPAYGSFSSLDREVIVFPRLFPDAATTVQFYEPFNRALEPTGHEFIMRDTLIRPVAVSECDRQIFAVGGNADLNLHAIPLPATGVGRPSDIPTGHSGQAVVFEPSTKTVIAPFGQGTSFDLGAYRVGGPREAPTLTRRSSDWAPPTDIRPIFVATRQPVPAICP